MNITVADEFTLTVGQSSLVMKKDGTVQINGKDIDVQGSGSVTIKAGKDVDIKAGAKLNAKAASTVTVKGSKVQMN